MFKPILKSNANNIGMLIALCTLLVGSVGHALSVDEGFDNIPWGSSIEFVRAEATGKVAEDQWLKWFQWNGDYLAQYCKATLAKPAHIVAFRGKYAEFTQYFFSDDKLCLVIHRPPYTKSFDAAGYVQYMELKLGREPSKKYRGNLAFPTPWGSYNMKTEYPLTVEWENDASLVRVAVEAWPLEELREIKNVVYTSKKLMAENEETVQLFKMREDDAKKKVEEARAKQKLAKQKALQELQN